MAIWSQELERFFRVYWKGYKIIRSNSNQTNFLHLKLSLSQILRRQLNEYVNEILASLVVVNE